MSDKSLEELKKEMGVAWDAYDAAYDAWDAADVAAAAARDAYHKKLREKK